MVPAVWERACTVPTTTVPTAVVPRMIGRPDLRSPPFGYAIGFVASSFSRCGAGRLRKASTRSPALSISVARFFGISGRSRWRRERAETPRTQTSRTGAVSAFSAVPRTAGKAGNEEPDRCFAMRGPTRHARVCEARSTLRCTSRSGLWPACAAPVISPGPRLPRRRGSHADHRTLEGCVGRCLKKTPAAAARDWARRISSIRGGS